MTHFSIFDSYTFGYVVQLKALNDLWFRALIGCAKRSPKAAKECVMDGCRVLKHLDIDSTKINIFQICKAVQSGILTVDSLTPYVSNNAWHVYRELHRKRIRDDMELSNLY